jgi:hypothetical protein
MDNAEEDGLVASGSETSYEESTRGLGEGQQTELPKIDLPVGNLSEVELKGLGDVAARASGGGGYLRRLRMDSGTASQSKSR